MAKQKVKTCKKCGVEKLLEKFSVHKECAGGYNTTCKDCVAANTRAHYARKKDNPTYKAKKKNSYIKSRYGITADEYDQRKEEQDHKCGICKTELQDGNATHLDHDHVTGKLRGMLCNPCNRALGYFKDDINILEKARDYLQEHSHA